MAERVELTMFLEHLVSKIHDAVEKLIEVGVRRTL